MENHHESISVFRQCELLGLNRSMLYYQPIGLDNYTLWLMRRLDEIYTEHPYYGVRRMTACLQREGKSVNEKRIRRLLRLIGLEAIYPKPNLSKPNREHKIYPYLLRGVAIEHRDQVFSADITYIRLSHGFVYLTQ